MAVWVSEDIGEGPIGKRHGGGEAEDDL